MPRQKDETLSGEVVLRSASGQIFNTETPITSENIAQYQPSAETAGAAQRAFAQAGFEVGTPAGVSLTITAPKSTFEKAFKAKITRDKSGAINVTGSGGEELGYDLPVNKLPPELAQYVVAATLIPPPTFGPNDY